MYLVITQWKGHNIRVRLRDSELLYVDDDGSLLDFRHGSPEVWERELEAHSIHLHPSAAQWQEFRAALDRINIWDWAPEYPSRGQMDGYSWSIELQYADRNMRSCGSNSEPNELIWNQYLEAVRRLVGGRPFNIGISEYTPRVIR